MRRDLCLTGVGRRHGLRGPWVLRGGDRTVPPGSLVRIEGANVTGKSTLPRLLAGVDVPTEGRATGAGAAHAGAGRPRAGARGPARAGHGRLSARRSP